MNRSQVRSLMDIYFSKDKTQPQQSFALEKTSWRRLSFVLSHFVLKTYSRRIKNVLIKTNTYRNISLDLKASSRCIGQATNYRKICLSNTSSRRPQDVFKLHCRNTWHKGLSWHYFFNPIQDGSFRGCLRMGGEAKSPAPPSSFSLSKICHTFPTLMELVKVLPYLKKIQTYMDNVTQHLISADISIFLPEFSKFRYIKI